MHTHPDMHSFTHTHTHPDTHAHIYPDTHTPRHTYTLIHSHTHTHIYIPTHLHTYIPHTYSNTLLSTYTYHTHIHTHPAESSVSSSCRLLEAVTTGFKASRPPGCCRAAPHCRDLITTAFVLSSHSSFFFPLEKSVRDQNLGPTSIHELQIFKEMPFLLLLGHFFQQKRQWYLSPYIYMLTSQS